MSLSYCPTLLPRHKFLNARRMVRVAGVEPAWTCAQDMWVAATLHPDLVVENWERAFQPSPFYPFTQTTWRNVCTTSTRSRCASITASMDLYAIGVSSMTSASLRSEE